MGKATQRISSESVRKIPTSNIHHRQIQESEEMNQKLSQFRNRNIMTMLLIVFAFLSINPSFPTQPKNGHELIKQMYHANKANWYQTLCFSQEVIYYKSDSIVKTDVWSEAYQSPGKLIIKFTGRDNGDGLLFTNDSMYSYQNDTLQSARHRIHDLIVLGLDINNIPPETTSSRAWKLREHRWLSRCNNHKLLQ